MPAHNAKYANPVMGARYGDRVVVSAEPRCDGGHTQWLVRCVCGADAWVNARDLVVGKKRGCRACMERRFAETAPAARHPAPSSARVVPHAPKVRGMQLHALQRLVDWIAAQPKPVRIAEIVGHFGNNSVTVQRWLTQAEKLGRLECVPASLTSPKTWRVPVRAPSEEVAA